MDPGARVMSGARIINLAGDDQAIRIGANTVVRGELVTLVTDAEIEVGEWCYIGEGARIWSAGKIVIGDRALVAHDVNIFDNQTHPMEAEARHAHVREIFHSGHPAGIDLGPLPVVVGKDAWIAARAIIMRGVRIGEGAIVGAGAVVTTDVADFTIVGGNPAKVVGRAPEDTMKADPSGISDGR